jgi:hypothetical protein
LLAGVSRKGFQGTAFVIFVDGTLHEQQITDEASFLKAQADTVRFNAMVAGASTAAGAANREAEGGDIGFLDLLVAGRLAEFHVPR